MNKRHHMTNILITLMKRHQLTNECLYSLYYTEVD